MYLDKYIYENNVSTDYPVFKDNIFVDLKMPVNDLFLAQYKDLSFNAVDIVFKYLAIENYYNINDYGFNLYNKLQYYRTGKDWSNRFKDLIKSFEYGYNLNSKVETDLNYSIHDGAHRVALCLFHNIDDINVRIFNTFLYRREYGFSYIEKYFNKNEINIIKVKLNELLNKCNHPYYCILWTPAYFIFNDLKKDLINTYDVNLLSDSIISFNEEKLRKFIYDVYKTDDIKKEKLDLKYKYIINSINKSGISSPYQVNLIKLDLNNPLFRLKPLTGLPQSKKTMMIKSYLRDKYQKSIVDYHYDIMMHMTDNTTQNRDVNKVLKKVGNL